MNTDFNVNSSTMAQDKPWMRRFLSTPGNVLIVLLLVALFWGVRVGALAPEATQPTSTNTIPYQGRLADANGSPLTDTYPMIFRLYNAASGGVPLWEEQWTGPNSVHVSDGLFNVMLGSLNSIPQNVITDNGTLFLGITVDTDDEMIPRVQLGSVPFSVQALTVPDGSISTAKIADASVTQAKLGADVGFSLDDGEVTTLKLANNAVTSAKIADGTVTAADLANSSVASAELVDNSVTSADILNGTITSADIAANAITSAQLRPTTGIAKMTTNQTLSLGGAWSQKAVPYGIATFSLSRNSRVMIWYASSASSVHPGRRDMILKVDGVEHFVSSVSSDNYSNFSGLSIADLGVGSHTIQLYIQSNINNDVMYFEPRRTAIMYQVINR